MNHIALMLLGATLLFTVSKANSSICGTDENFGKVQRIYPQYYPEGLPEVPSNAHKPGTFFRLSGGLSNALLPNGYYHISANGTSIVPPAHTRQSMYRTMEDLLVVAAKNGWTVVVRTNNCAAAQANAPVEYLVVDFP
jgi:hypothetical protein